jgi:hypothetical protein
VRDLAVLAALHEEIDAYFERAYGQAVAAGDQAAIDRTKTKRRLNEQAYFVLCWGQLEAEIDSACRMAIRTRRSHADWNVRRGWDRYDPDERRISGLRFEDRVALVTDRAGGRGSPWQRILHYYNIRNKIAHGTLPSEGMSVPEVAREFYRIQAALSRE